MELSTHTIEFVPYLIHGHSPSPSCPHCQSASSWDGPYHGQRCVKGVGGGDKDMMVMTRRHIRKKGEKCRVGAYAGTRACTHACMHARMHARMHTQTHSHTHKLTHTHIYMPPRSAWVYWSRLQVWGWELGMALVSGVPVLIRRHCIYLTHTCAHNSDTPNDFRTPKQQFYDCCFVGML